MDEIKKYLVICTGTISLDTMMNTQFSSPATSNEAAISDCQTNMSLTKQVAEVDWIKNNLKTNVQPIV